MAASTAPPSTTLLLSHATASSVFPQDLSISSSRPKPHFLNCSNTFSLYPVLLLRCRGRKPTSNWIDGSSSKSGTYPVVVAAVASEAKVAQDLELEEDEDGVNRGAFTAPTKPKKGKAALPLKRDRVCA